MKTKLLTALLALALAGCGTHERTKLDVAGDDPEQLAKLAPATQVALVLKTPIWLVALGVFFLGLQGISSKIKVNVSRKEKGDE